MIENPVSREFVFQRLYRTDRTGQDVDVPDRLLIRLDD
jgi:hypothetical protein